MLAEAHAQTWWVVRDTASSQQAAQRHWLQQRILLHQPYPERGLSRSGGLRRGAKLLAISSAVTEGSYTQAAVVKVTPVMAVLVFLRAATSATLGAFVLTLLGVFVSLRGKY